MANMLEPRKVEQADLKVWLSESLGLFRRRPLLFTLIAVVYYFLSWHTADLAWFSLLFGLLLCQLFIAVLIITAQAVDEGRLPKPSEYLRNIKHFIAYLFGLSCLYLLIFMLFALIAMYVDMPVPHTDHRQHQLYPYLQWLEPGMVWFYVMYCVIVVSGFWFITSVIALTGLDLRSSLRLAKKAERLNEWVVFVISYFPFLLFYLLLLVSLISTVISVFGLTFFGILQYVSFRHVFLGRRENKPVDVKLKQARLALDS